MEDLLSNLNDHRCGLHAFSDSDDCNLAVTIMGGN
jgi:hypothetical protein